MNTVIFYKKNVATIKLRQVSDKICAICFDSFSSSARIYKTPCNHFHHISCLNRWLQKSLKDCNIESCPLCRTEFNGLHKKLDKIEELLDKNGDFSSSAMVNRAIDEWEPTETSYSDIINFVEFFISNSQLPDNSPDLANLRKKINSIRIQGRLLGEIPISDQSNMIRFEGTQKLLELCQQGCEEFSHLSPGEKKSCIHYIRTNLQYGRQCGMSQRVNELEFELNRLLIQGIVKEEIPISDQPDMIRFEVAKKCLELCQQDSEEFTQLSPDEKGDYLGYTRSNLQYGRQCGMGQRVNELQSELNSLLIQGILKDEISLYGQPDIIYFEVAKKQLHLCQKGSEEFIQLSPDDKKNHLEHIRNNLQYGRLCEMDQRVNELESELNSLLIQEIVKDEIPISGQPDMICFEVAKKCLELCQQGSEEFTQLSPDDKEDYLGYIGKNLRCGRECGLDQMVKLLLNQLDVLKTELRPR